jgi:hypothetical protein
VNAVTGTSQVADEVVTLVKEHSLFEFTETNRDTVDKQEQMMR